MHAAILQRKAITFWFIVIIFASGNLYSINSQYNKTIMNENRSEVTTFASGCFWCTEAIFDRVKGVVSVVSGYSGGEVVNPSYKEVCNGNTGHAEAIQVTFNPDEVSYVELLEIFFKTHDPTTLNRQGADVGTQYRSAIFYHTPSQREQAVKIIDALNSEKIWKDPIVTEVTAFSNFYPAEDYHQEYFDNNGDQGYCRMVIQPKVEKFEKVFRDKLK